ncbi:glutathione S-transferase [Rhodovarius crocodyli]|uniref:Glutathione S-transferase n=1 Tax=Rhodovarius crocodyli TaxID=1979269 RepID=A0A437MNR5_9PROT|nr:glutathione S-transferase N-terminal domain-containing protein [Rhodovarius crocodyli]RVT99276.1 glutathione S-transferase [Rhodovarius crocodyli]
MKLHYSPTSPFVRKVVIAAMLRGLNDKIERVSTNPHESPAGLLADNPLSKVPALVTDEGKKLIDSLVICEYLDTLGGEPTILPAANRIGILNFHAIADGLLDAAVARRGSAQLPQDDGRKAFDARQKGIVDRALAVMEGGKLPPQPLSCLGGITLVCALGYLDFRYAHEPWRETHPKLAAWYEGVKATPAVAETVPA